MVPTIVNGPLNPNTNIQQPSSSINRNGDYIDIKDIENILYDILESNTTFVNKHISNEKYAKELRTMYIEPFSRYINEVYQLCIFGNIDILRIYCLGLNNDVQFPARPYNIGEELYTRIMNKILGKENNKK